MSKSAPASGGVDMTMPEAEQAAVVESKTPDRIVMFTESQLQGMLLYWWYREPPSNIESAKGEIARLIGADRQR